MSSRSYVNRSLSRGVLLAEQVLINSSLGHGWVPLLKKGVVKFSRGSPGIAKTLTLKRIFVINQFSEA